MNNCFADEADGDLIAANLAELVDEHDADANTDEDDDDGADKIDDEQANG